MTWRLRLLMKASSSFEQVGVRMLKCFLSCIIVLLYLHRNVVVTSKREGCLSCDLYYRLSMAGVRSHHLILRLGVDAHNVRVAIGNSLAFRVFLEKSLHILNIRCS